LFGEQVQITDSPEVYRASVSPRINYSVENMVTGECRIHPEGLLQEISVSPRNVCCMQWNGLPAFFATPGSIPFDLLAASFYLITRYEEYGSAAFDEYGRYDHTASLAWQHNFLRLPLVNLWITELYKECFPAFAYKKPPFIFVPTYDVDIAWSYLHRPVWTNVLGFYRDLLRGDFDKVVERGNVYSGWKKDPFDTFNWLDALHDRLGLQPVYFLLMILRRGPYDKNLPARSKALQKLYARLSERYAVGLHPSWQSGTEEYLLQEEKKRLEGITGHPITSSRNHYLRFCVPHGYRRLLEAGMRNDYSMAYATVNGFRASYTLPFFWYDLGRDQQTELCVHPFCYMEANSFFEQKYTPAQAMEELQYYNDIIKQTGGVYTTLFHNHFLTEQPQWRPWREMYLQFLEKNFSK